MSTSLPCRLATLIAAVTLLIVFAPSTSGQGYGTASWQGTTLTKSLGPSGLVPYTAYLMRGDYRAAGVGMRNKGYGTITIGIPTGATIRRAFLYFAYINPTIVTSFAGTLNGTAITPVWVGTSSSPCWPGDNIHAFRADVTGIAVDGANVLANFPSGYTGGGEPDANVTPPLMEGATLVVYFSHPDYDYNALHLYEGASTFALDSRTLSVAAPSTVIGSALDEIARTTYIVADGQNAPNDGTKFNGTPTSGPGSTFKIPDAFDGADGHLSVSLSKGLWDTHTLDVSSFFSPPTPLPVTLQVDASMTGGDCLTWLAQVWSVKYAIPVAVDIKPGSCPNSINVGSNGLITVAILGSATFNVTNIDPTTIQIYGVSSTGWYQYGDAAGPYAGFTAECNDCGTAGPDGYTDLKVKFDTQALMAALQYNPPMNKECRPAILVGYLNNGMRIMGRDIIRFVVGGNPKETEETAEVTGFALLQNTPNPFSPSTAITYALPAATHTRLAVYDIVGREVAVLVDRAESQGMHTVSWNGTDKAGAQLPSGVYLYRLTAGTQSTSMKLVIAR
jgi:hypothetical protein